MYFFVGDLAIALIYIDPEENDSALRRHFLLGFDFVIANSSVTIE